MTFRHVNIVVLGLVLVSISSAFAETRQATGVKVGEVSTDSAIVWVRLTAKSERNTTGLKFPLKDSTQKPSELKVSDFHGACPGAEGKVRVRYALNAELKDAVVTEWTTVTAKSDFVYQFHLKALKSGTLYHFAAETADNAGKEHDPVRGRFETAPASDKPAEILFTAVTCQGFDDLDDPTGYHAYPSMLKLEPKFFVPNGDNVYYDGDDPVATTIDLARFHWHRMHSVSRHAGFHARVPGYWLKDDHDCFCNDCWPEMKAAKMAPLTYKEGTNIFREQVPMGEKTYRTARWGKDLQLWFVEGRDYRSPNNMADGPEKSIWGKEQVKWLQESMNASDATWKILVSPTPIVGPDRSNKGDNHSNKAFAHEGKVMRSWFKENIGDNLFVICGDRHWQYHSAHPDTGLQEFCTGPTSDAHASGSPGEDKAFHKFHRVKGGFLSVKVYRVEGKPTITFRLHDVQGKEVYGYNKSKE